MKLTLEPILELFAVSKLEAGESVPAWAMMGEWWSITKTHTELSIVCLQDQVPVGESAERDWRMLKLSGQLDFALVGILAALTKPLAEASISVFAVSTFDTDYLLVKAAVFDAAVRALTDAGISIRG